MNPGAESSAGGTLGDPKAGASRYTDAIGEPVCRASTCSPSPLVGRDMLCFSHDWTGDPLSKTHLMRILARDNRILWVNSIGYRAPNLGSGRDWGRILQKLKQAAAPVREVEPNLFVLSPLAVPGLRSPRWRALNARLLAWQVRRAMRRLGFERPLNWVFNPAAGELAGSLGESDVVYYCVDEYTKFAGVDTGALAQIESDLIAKSCATIVSAERLIDAKRRPGAEPILVRHGVDFAHFRRALDAETVVPDDVAGLPRPIVGYFGLMSEDWVDVDLLVHVAKSLPEATLVLLGKATMDLARLTELPNVRWLGRKPYRSLPSYCKGFDAAVIPFPISEVTLAANPLKAREYLAAGLPVVSTRIPEVEALGQCRIGGTHDAFVAELRSALRNPGPNRARSETMRTESWEARVETLREILAPRLRGGMRS